MTTLDEGEALVERVRTSNGEVTAHAILLEAVGPIIDRFSIYRASIRTVVPETPLLEVLAVWTSGRTMLTVGARMSSGSTAFPEILATGRPQLRSRVDENEGLLDQIMATEGIRSYVTMPLRRGGRLIGLLSLSSRQAGAFVEADLPQLSGVAEVVEAALTHVPDGG